MTDEQTDSHHNHENGAETTRFDLSFWKAQFTQLGYPLKEEPLDIATLRKQRVFPQNFSPSSVLRLYNNSFMEIALIVVKSGEGFTRSLCTQTARRWKENRLIKPILLFTNQWESFAVIVPGKGVQGDTKILRISDTLYRTDSEVIESMVYVSDPQELSKLYDTSFFPYERVRNEFFEGYRDLYQKIEKAIGGNLKKYSTAYAQRFLGRLMFLYFLQRKGWLKKNKRFIDTIKDFRQLNELFYESLNKEGMEGIPFLNGSLFEMEEYMDDAMQKRLTKNMDPLFREARDFFNRYNFTVDETAPLELEVSIDPALIGTVFENMLPENERGGKGTFYTPLNESSFICRRALANYLGCKDEVDQKRERFIDGLDLLIEDLRSDKSERKVRELRDKLLSLRILDPAVGSGGFLLVMMQEIINLIKEAEAIVGWKSDPEQYKKRILPNLYGFDIEAEAIEIARLRLWLSLIIDQREPEPLPNLDMNLVVIEDTLRLPRIEQFIDEETESLSEQYDRTYSTYVNEHSPRLKKKHREEMERLSREISRRTGDSMSVIESHMHVPAHIVVMNPPYVRQESIPSEKKRYYTDKYGVDRKSDLYVYFLTRAIKLASAEGVISVISSDKWLETGYGVSLQKKLKNHIIAIYGQRERSFGADINTVVTVYSARDNSDSVIDFTYLEKYGVEKIRRHYAILKKDLQPGKWFYLRAPKIFMEKILPKLTHKLSDFAEIKRGFTTGANEFFYMKDISHLYEMDYLANPKKFEEWGVRAKNKKELEHHGLTYIQNEGGVRFVLEKQALSPLMRSIRDFPYPRIDSEPKCFCLRTSQAQVRDFPLTTKYIKLGEHTKIEVTRGSNNGSIIGYDNISTIKTRKPWYALPNLTPAHIAMPELYSMRFITLSSELPYLADHLFDVAYSKLEINDRVLFHYLNSTIYFMMLELWSPRMGGGALHPRTVEFKTIPVPNLAPMKSFLDKVEFGKRETKAYDEEIKESDKQTLDTAVLRGMGFSEQEIHETLPRIYEEYIELVNDRLLKAGKNISNKLAINDDFANSQAGIAEEAE